VKLSEIRGGAAPHPARPADEPTNAVQGGGNGAEGDVQKGTSPSVEEPWGVANSVTPSGLEVYYQAGPKRLYRIRNTWRGPEVDIPSEWQEVPSVSTVLDCLEKGGLSWWGMKVGVEGALHLIDSGFASSPEDDAERVIELLKEHKLTVNHVKNQAADRGTNVHSALESWVETGVTPDPNLFPENERGYVQGLLAFINDAHPHPLHSELMVASMKGFAGRFDLLANLDGEVVTKTYPKRKPIRSQISGAWLLDLKTSKDVYPSYHLQLAAYREAMTECGYGTADHAGVVRVTSDGRYELVESKASFDDFLHVLNTYHVIRGLKK